MRSAKEPIPVGQDSGSVRRAALFDREMGEAHRRADHTKRRPLAARWRLGQIYAGESKPWDTQRKIYDDLLASGADESTVLAIAELHPLYVKRRIAERAELPTPSAALRLVAKEVGEATVAQIIYDQSPTPENKQRAESETRDVLRVKETYLMSLCHRAGHTLGQAVQHSGARVW